MIEDEWVTIPSWPDYQVNGEGLVRSLRRGQPWIMSPTPHHKTDYLQLKVVNGEGKKHQFVHVLVAEAFLGPKPEGMQVAHGDGDRRNNRPANLSYKTPLENSHQKRDHGTQVHGERVNTAKLNASQIPEIRRRAVTGESARAIARDYGVGETAIRDAVARRTWGHVE